MLKVGYHKGMNGFIKPWMWATDQLHTRCSDEQQLRPVLSVLQVSLFMRRCRTWNRQPPTCSPCCCSTCRFSLWVRKESSPTENTHTAWGLHYVVFTFLTFNLHSISNVLYYKDITDGLWWTLESIPDFLWRFSWIMFQIRDISDEVSLGISEWLQTGAAVESSVA